jgi:REP element-mobilizing transposase RayT
VLGNDQSGKREQGSAGVPPAVSGASRPRFGDVTVRDRGRLPHWESEGAVYFVTFRLADSLPQSVVRAFEAERDDIVKTAKRLGRELSASERKQLARLFSKRVQSYLDKGAGICHLCDPRIAALVTSAMTHFDGKHYRLFAWCIMPNHVHVVVKPFLGRPLSGLLHSWKSFSAKKANAILGAQGTFWQREYYDHLIRDEDESARVIRYVLDNPAKARLKGWPWVWAYGQGAYATSDEDDGTTTCA